MALSQRSWIGLLSVVAGVVVIFLYARQEPPIERVAATEPPRITEPVQLEHSHPQSKSIRPDSDKRNLAIHKGDTLSFFTASDVRPGTFTAHIGAHVFQLGYRTDVVAKDSGFLIITSSDPEARLDVYDLGQLGTADRAQVDAYFAKVRETVVASKPFSEATRHLHLSFINRMHPRIVLVFYVNFLGQEVLAFPIDTTSGYWQATSTDSVYRIRDAQTNRLLVEFVYPQIDTGCFITEDGCRIEQ